MAKPPIVRDKLVQFIKDLGPMTAAELANAAGLTHKQVDDALHGARKRHGREFFVIRDWHRNTGRQGDMAAVYGLGPGVDKRKPPADDSRTRNARWREKHRAELRAQKNALKGVQKAAHPFAELRRAAGVIYRKPSKGLE